MNLLDMRTVVFSYTISNFICMIVMAILWKQNHKRFAGIGFWMADFVMQFTALVMLALRGAIPDFLSMTGSNALIIGGTVLIYIGLEQFTGKRGPQAQNYLLLGVFIAAHGFFTLVSPNLAIRADLVSLGLLAICSQCAWLTLRRVPAQMRRFTRGTGYVFAAFCLVSIIRLLIDLSIPAESDFFHSNVYDTLSILTYQMLFILLTLSLFLMVNRRLFADLESDIIAREQAESALLRSEKIIRLRLRLWEFAADHPVDELMQTALDEIEQLTGSTIGFYHFVDDDENALSLQAWSTRTQAEFCTAQGKGMHYPISEAGVWVDCVSAHKAVIHNDYASLPHRKGLPPGHAQVIRELVAPTIRQGRVVSILGVGNKPSEYHEDDIELVAYIADLVWSIVEKRQADDQIRQLNTKLEHLAMTDELTGLTNRRSFYIQGTKEIKRAQRYGTPFSLLMLDLDEFKTINDQFGHEAGDRMLQCIANTLTANIRQTDLLARMGGEEFSVILPNTGIQDAVRLAERLRQAVEATGCPISDRQMNVTVSVGVASYQESISFLDDLLRDADTAMYRAKNQGRNRVVILDKASGV